MKMLRNIFLMCLGLSSFCQLAFSQGGGMGGNGGNAIVCYSDASRNKITSVQMFDYWEWQQLSPIHYPLDLGAPQLPLDLKIEIFRQRLERYDPIRSQSYSQGLLELYQHIDDYLVDGPLTMIVDDHSRAQLPQPPCFKEQFAIQLRDPAPGMKRFRIDRRIYSDPATDNDVRFGLLLHEVLYREFMTNGDLDSDRARYFNYLLSTNAFSEANVALYLKTLNELRGKILVYTPVQFRLGDTQNIALLNRHWSTSKTISGVADWKITFNSQLYRGNLVETNAAGTSINNILNFNVEPGDVWLANVSGYYNPGLNFEGFINHRWQRILVPNGYADRILEFQRNGLPLYFQVAAPTAWLNVNGEDVECLQMSLDGEYSKFKLTETGEALNCHYVQPHRVRMYGVEVEVAEFQAVNYGAPRFGSVTYFPSARVSVPVPGCGKSLTIESKDGSPVMLWNREQNWDFYSYGQNQTLPAYSSIRHDRWKVNNCQVELGIFHSFPDSTQPQLVLSPAGKPAQITEYGQSICKKAGYMFDDVDKKEITNTGLFTEYVEVDTGKAHYLQSGEKVMVYTVSCKETLLRPIQ